MADYYSFATYQATADFIKSKLPVSLGTIKLGLVLGSGLQDLVKVFDKDQDSLTLNYADIPNFGISTVPGHSGQFVFGYLKGVPSVCMVGRKHIYEGHAPIRTVFPIRIMKLLGVSHVILTNASGGLNPKFSIGDIMIISDHVSFGGMAGQNPLIGPNIPQFGPRFPPISAAYDFGLRLKAVLAAKQAGIPRDMLKEGTYSFVLGPSFETRAEARFLRDGLGGDCVGMSTVPEVVAATHCGMKVLALSLITNKVAVGKGRSALEFHHIDSMDSPIFDDEAQLATHEEVLDASQKSAQMFQGFIEKIVDSIRFDIN